MYGNESIVRIQELMKPATQMTHNIFCPPFSPKTDEELHTPPCSWLPSCQQLCACHYNQFRDTDPQTIHKFYPLPQPLCLLWKTPDISGWPPQAQSDPRFQIWRRFSRPRCTAGMSWATSGRLEAESPSESGWLCAAGATGSSTGSTCIFNSASCTLLKQGTQVSMATLRAATTHQTPSHWPSQWRYLPTLNLPHPPMREGGWVREKTAAQTHVWELETNCTTSHSWNAQYVRFEKPRMSRHGTWSTVYSWPALARLKLSLNYI